MIWKVIAKIENKIADLLPLIDSLYGKANITAKSQICIFLC